MFFDERQPRLAKMRYTRQTATDYYEDHDLSSQQAIAAIVMGQT